MPAKGLLASSSYHSPRAAADVSPLVLPLARACTVLRARAPASRVARAISSYVLTIVYDVEYFEEMSSKYSTLYI
jgi:hypothetical protein